LLLIYVLFVYCLTQTQQKMELDLVKKQENKGVNMRLVLPKSLHNKVKKHQYTLIGKPTMADAALDLIIKGIQNNNNA